MYVCVCKSCFSECAHANIIPIYMYTVHIQDILVTQSEYVKGELIRLRQSLQDLEDRAGNIETDIRNAMSEGSAAQCVCIFTHVDMTGLCVYRR